MRRWMMLTALVSGEALCFGSASAQPFGFLFGQRPQYAHRAPRPHGQARRQITTPDVPLPVPRPHFAEDLKPAAKPEETVAAPATAPTPVAPTTKPEGAAPLTVPVTSPTPPIPPPKPPEIVAAPASSAPAPAAGARPPNEMGPTLPPAKPDGGPPLTVPVTAPTPPTPPPKPDSAKTDSAKPGIAASGATTVTSPRQIDDDASCVGRLKTAAVTAETTSLAPQPDARCTVVQPVRLSSLKLPDGEDITFPDKPLLACATAEAFSAYVRDLLSPLAKGTFGTRVGAVWTGPGLECRSRDHIFGAKLSAHGQGLAVDVAQIKLADGRMLAVGEPKAPPESVFETAARNAGCGYFHTVLGPGSDSYHRTHWHFDLEVRGAKGDTKFCH